MKFNDPVLRGLDRRIAADRNTRSMPEPARQAMPQETCALLIADWFAVRSIKADHAALAAWLYAGGDTVNANLTQAAQSSIPTTIPKLGPYGEGSAAFGAGHSNLKCPYADGTEDSMEWARGWRDAQIDNGQFGVGA